MVRNAAPGHDAANVVSVMQCGKDVVRSEPSVAVRAFSLPYERGSVSPSAPFHLVMKILCGHFTCFSDPLARLPVGKTPLYLGKYLTRRTPSPSY